MTWTTSIRRESSSWSYRSERGSFLVGAALFMLLFLGVAALGIDGGRYYMKKSNLQNIADGAALTGAQSFNGYDTRPNLKRVRESVVNYVKNQQSSAHADLYDPDETNIQIVELNSPQPDPNCTQGFALNNNQLILTQPARLESEVIGSAITSGAGGPPIPVTSRIEIQTKDGDTEIKEPWGEYSDPNDGDVNAGGSIPPADVQTQSAGSTVTLSAQSWWGPGSPIMESKTGGPDVTTLSKGDSPPSGKGMGDQADMQSFVQEYVDASTGRIDIKQNQAIVFFELGTSDETSSAYDSQDLVLLLSVNPTSSGGNTGSGRNSYVNVSASGSQSPACSPYPRGTYRVGVLVFENFRPVFLPEAVFGANNHSMMQKAVAEIRPQNVLKTVNLDMNCGVFADEQVAITGNNVNGQDVNICSNSDILASNSLNGTLGDLYAHDQAVIKPPGGSVGRTEKFPDKLPKPTFDRTDSNLYDVDLSEFNYWADNGHCPGGPADKKAMRTQKAGWDYVEWTSGDKICVEYDSASDRYVIDATGNPGKMQLPDGSPVSIYSDGSFTLNGNGTGLKGGLYARGDITVNDNNHEFTGDPSTLDGLALWAEGNVYFTKNNVTVEGITGSEGDYTFGSAGGGTGPGLSGILVSHGKFVLESNSNNATLAHDPTNYNPNALSNLDQQQFSQSTTDQPLYANVRVKLIH